MKLTHKDHVADIAAELVNQMHHTGAIDTVRRWEQTRELYDLLVTHPSFVRAEQRRKDRHWKFIERCAREVEKWPDWMKGAIRHV